MQHLQLNPVLTEKFKLQMLSNDWLITHQDAGQTHLVGWGYEIFWQKAESTVILRYTNKQDSEVALLQISSVVFSDIEDMIRLLND
ncbi:MAG: hypothetical protein ISEC1_P0484 [Thiomicrorhabdus sp.]|nr:MAG: hypothetical protein ISEC1_P0484 [Thiomicrorhabdus sp.]